MLNGTSKISGSAARSSSREAKGQRGAGSRSRCGQFALLGVALLGLVIGGVLQVADAERAARIAWTVATTVVLVLTSVEVVRGLLRRETGVDVIAVLAMLGALLLGESLAGAIIALMLTGGTSLERFAVARARRDLSELLRRAPRTAHRRSGTEVVDVDVDHVALGDVLVVKPGEVVPADGVVLRSSGALLDESALTGESRPVTLEAGDPIRSGGTNTGGPIEVRVTAPAAESTYAGILHLVRSAEGSKAHFVRLADRYALGFLVVTLSLAGWAWIASDSPTRALAVLVVATPCPLILAAPAAIIAGVSRAAKHGIIVKGGGPLETLARVTVLLLDKTGTVTSARPEVISVETFGSYSSDDVARRAASLEQVSGHSYAAAILSEARSRNVSLSFPTQVHEEMGIGISGVVEGEHIAVGQLRFVAADACRTPALRPIEVRTSVEGSVAVYVSVGGTLAGALLLRDPVRPEAPRALRALRAAGVRRIYMVTGDHPDVADLVGDVLGVDRVFAERTPEEKVEVVRLVRAEGVTAMAGDGINDAPALALADVGIAMGARGATAASEAADVVLTVDRLEGLALAVRLAQRTRRIALQSVWVGMGLSLVAMGFAAAGHITPVVGAVLQEGIDVLVIANALRALGGGGMTPQRLPEAHRMARGLSTAHRALRPHVGELASLAARLDTLPGPEARQQLERMRKVLEHELLPHEQEEQRTAYPVLARMLGDEDPTEPLIQTHHEIHRLVRLFGRLVAQVPVEGPRPEELRDLRRALYGLHAILTLHFDQEEQLYSLLEA